MKPTSTLAFVLCAALAAPALSQPTPASPTAAVSDGLFGCKKRVGEVAVKFDGETQVHNLITWVMSFTCKNVLLDPRTQWRHTTLEIVAPETMSVEDAYRLALAAFRAMDLDVVPKGNVMRIVSSAHAIVTPRTIPAVYYRGATLHPQPRRLVLTATKPDPSAPMTFELSSR